MSVRANHEMAASGLSWAPMVPAYWRVCEIKRVAALQSGDAITADRINETGDYPVFGGGGQRGYTDAFTHDGHFALIGRQGALCGNVNYGTGRFWASEHAVVATPRIPVDTTWLGETLRAMNLNQYSVSAAQPGLSVDSVSRLRLPVPPLEEQLSIAAFLERETYKIDTLVTEQERLMTLLREKRQAVISHAVTKGINTDAPLKCSGVFWLGDIPAHWDLVPLKRPLRSIEQGWSPQCEAYPAETDDEWGVLKVGAVNGGTFNPRENKLLPSDLVPEPSLALRTGDLLVSRANTRELVGSAAVVRSDFPRLLLCDKLYRLRFDPAAVDPEFVSSFLGSSNVRGQIELVASGASASMVNIAQSAILELRLPVPPTDEQVSILDFIRCESDKLHALSVEAEQATTLLLERRRALIIAAVTGQIDVRHLAPADAA